MLTNHIATRLVLASALAAGLMSEARAQDSDIQKQLSNPIASLTLLPIQGVAVDISTDIAGANVIWAGDTDTFGVARDDAGYLPRLDPGTYYFWCSRPGITFINPDTEIVS